MHLVEIDVIHFQPPQTGFDFRHDMPARESNLIRRHRLAHENIRVEPNFCRDNQIFSPRADDSPENFLRRARRVDVRGVEEITPDLDKPVENFSRCGFICFASKRHAAKAKFRYFQSRTA